MTPPLLIPREKHHKVRPVSVWTLAKTTVAAPLVSITVLPLTMVYQTGRKLLQPHPKSLPRSLDSGHIAKNVIPRVARRYDLVLLGATGFTGYLAARYLVLHQHSTTTTTGRPLRWALAGRSTTKLEQVKVRLAQECQQQNIKVPISLDTILVDTADPTTLPALVQNTRVVATTVGPYRLYGSSVVEFCAKYGTHYVDITGEVDWVKFMVTQWQATAQHTGATLIPFCGHDSVPWDLCVQQMQKALQASANDDLATVTFWDEMKGAAPGGTYATLWEAARSPIPRHPAATMDPFLRLPDGTKSAHVVKDKSPTLVSPARSPWDDQSSSRRWTGPFVMATVNAQVVRWSHALRQSNHPALTYREMQVFPDGPTAWCHLANLAAFGILLGNPLTAQWLKHAVLPRPGQGPSMQQMLHKHYLIIYGEGIGVQGNRVETILYFPRDVGCLDTARMLVESALCLLHKEASGDLRGGFWTPSTALGEDLWQRLLATGTHFNMRVVPKEDVMRSRL